MTRRAATLTATALAAAATALLGAAPATAAPAPAPVDPAALAAQRVVDLANAERAAAGCAALVVDPLLTLAAAAHSADMAAMGTLTHVGSDGSTFVQRIRRSGFRPARLAENAAAGYATADDVVRGWLESPPHRANLLDCRLGAVGVGLAGDPAAPYWTLDLGARR